MVVLAEERGPRLALVGVRAAAQQVVEALGGQAVAQLGGQVTDDLLAPPGLGCERRARPGQQLVGERVGHDVRREVPGGPADRLAHEGVQEDAVGERVGVGVRGNLVGAREVVQEAPRVHEERGAVGRKRGG